MECEIRELQGWGWKGGKQRKGGRGRIIYGVYLADEIFLRQEETLQLNTLFSWKLCTGNRIHEAEENKNKWKEEYDKEAVRCSLSPVAVALPS